ncbi:MAG: hypothetical protein ACYCOO_08310 [Chitinophagaceae bacterium]
MNSHESPIRVIDFATLEQKKAQLRARCRLLEREMVQRVDHLKEHSVSMAIHSVFPKGSNKMDIVTHKGKEVLTGILGKSEDHPLLYGTLRKAIQMLLLGQGMKLASSLFKKGKSHPVANQ